MPKIKKNERTEKKKLTEKKKTRRKHSKKVARKYTRYKAVKVHKAIPKLNVYVNEIVESKPNLLVDSLKKDNKSKQKTIDKLETLIGLIHKFYIKKLEANNLHKQTNKLNWQFKFKKLKEETSSLKDQIKKLQNESHPPLLAWNNNDDSKHLLSSILGGVSDEDLKKLTYKQIQSTLSALTKLENQYKESLKNNQAIDLKKVPIELEFYVDPRALINYYKDDICNNKEKDDEIKKLKDTIAKIKIDSKQVIATSGKPVTLSKKKDICNNEEKDDEIKKLKDTIKKMEIDRKRMIATSGKPVTLSKLENEIILKEFETKDLKKAQEFYLQQVNYFVKLGYTKLNERQKLVHKKFLEEMESKSRNEAFINNILPNWKKVFLNRKGQPDKHLNELANMLRNNPENRDTVFLEEIKKFGNKHDISESTFNEVTKFFSFDTKYDEIDNPDGYLLFFKSLPENQVKKYLPEAYVAKKKNIIRDPSGLSPNSFELSQKGKKLQQHINDQLPRINRAQYFIQRTNILKIIFKTKMKQYPDIEYLIVRECQQKLSWKIGFKVNYKICIDQLARDLKTSKALPIPKFDDNADNLTAESKNVWCIDSQKAVIINKAANLIFSNLKPETSNTSDTSSETNVKTNAQTDELSKTKRQGKKIRKNILSKVNTTGINNIFSGRTPKGGVRKGRNTALLAALKKRAAQNKVLKSDKQENKKKVEGNQSIKAKTVPSSKPDGSNNIQQNAIVLLQTNKQQLDKIPKKEMRRLEFVFQTSGTEDKLKAAAPEVNLSTYINSNNTNLIFGYPLKRYNKLRPKPTINAGEVDKPEPSKESEVDKPEPSKESEGNKKKPAFLNAIQNRKQLKKTKRKKNKNKKNPEPEKLPEVTISVDEENRILDLFIFNNDDLLVTKEQFDANNENKDTEFVQLSGVKENNFDITKPVFTIERVKERLKQLHNSQIIYRKLTFIEITEKKKKKKKRQKRIGQCVAVKIALTLIL